MKILSTSEARKLVYDFVSLPHVIQRQILNKFDLKSDNPDKNLALAECFKQVQGRNLLEVFAEEVKNAKIRSD